MAEGSLEHFYFSAGLEVQLLQQGGAQVVPLYPGMEDLRVSACRRRWWVGKLDVALKRDGGDRVRGDLSNCLQVERGLRMS